MALNVERIVGTHTTAFVSSPCVLSSRTSVSNGIVKDYRMNGNDRYKTMTLDAHEFIRRFLYARAAKRIPSTSRRLSLSESWLALAGCRCFRFGGSNQTFANSSLAGELASAANSFRFLPHFSFRRLFIGGPESSSLGVFPRAAFFLQEFQRLVDVIVADCNEQNISNLALANRRCGTQSRHATPRSPSSAPFEPTPP